MNDSERLELGTRNHRADIGHKFTESQYSNSESENRYRYLEHSQCLDSSPETLKSKQQKEEHNDNHIEDQVAHLAEVEDSKKRNSEISRILLSSHGILIGIFRCSEVLLSNWKNLCSIMLDRPWIDITEVIKICVIVVNISNGREVQARNAVLDDCKVCEVRHELIDNCGQGVSVWILCCRCIQVNHLLISRACLKKKSWSPWTTSLNIDHKADIVKDFPIVLPDGLHSHHAHFLSISKEDLHTLMPVVTLLEQLRYRFKSNSNSITVISGAI